MSNGQEDGVARFEERKPEAYDFYRCFECGWMFTRLEEIRDVFTTGTACKRCGSKKYRAAQYQWHFRFRPKVIYYWFAIRKHVKGPLDVNKKSLVARGLMKAA